MRHLLVVVLPLFAACTEPDAPVTPADWHIAERLCAPHGGLAEALVSQNQLKTRCRDGTVIRSLKDAIVTPRPTQYKET